MILETVCVGPMQVNCYILAKEKNSGTIIIDPGDQVRKIQRVLDKHKLKPHLIINTHGHYDHIGCDDKFDVPIYIHNKDVVFLNNPQLNLSGVFALPNCIKSEIRTLEDNDMIEGYGIQLQVIHVPGHTPGAIALLMKKPMNKVLFTGDTLLCQGIGRTDFSGGDESLLIRSIKEKLLRLSDDTVIYPGHGPSSTIGQEKEHNPFLI